MKPHHVESFNRGFKEGFSLGLSAGFIGTVLLALLLVFLSGCKTVEPTPHPTGDPEIWQPENRAQPVEAY